MAVLLRIFFSFNFNIHIPPSDMLTLKEKSTCQTVITPTSFHPRVGTCIITIYTNPVESDHAISTFPTFPSFFYTLATGSVTLYPKLYLYISFLIFPPICPISRRKIRYDTRIMIREKACCLRHLDEEEVFGCE